MADFTAKQLIRRADLLAKERRLWEPHWQQIADHLIPRKANITTVQTRGAKKQKERFASVGMHSHEILAANLQGTLTSRSFRWFDLKLDKDDELSELRDVREWLQLSARKIWRAFNGSNFHSQSHEFYIDITGFGTGCMFMEGKRGPDDFNGFVFTTYPIESYVFEEDSSGQPNAIAIAIAWTADQAISKFGKDALPEKIVKTAEEDPDKEWPFLHWVYPRRTRDDSKIDAVNMRWASVYISVEHEAIVQEGGYVEFPAFPSRWTRNTGEKYGRGPGTTALPDIKVLDKATELELNAWAKHIDPPWFMLDDGVVGKVNLKPGKGTILREKEALWFFEFRGRPDIGRIKLDDLRNTIAQTFFADQLELPQSDRMTAEEIRTRVELMQRILGPTLGRLETEYLNPMIERAFGMMLRGGALSPPPVQLEERGDNIDIRYSGPLARSERMSEVTSVLRLLETAAPLAQIDPSVMDKIDLDKALDYIAENLDTPEQILRDQVDIEALRTMRAEAQQQQAQVNQGLAIAEIAERGAKAKNLANQ